MKKRSSLPTPSKQALTYSAVASAALATGAHQADAQIIYSGVQDLNISQGFAQNLNLDGDASGDILLKNYVLPGGNYQGATVNYFPGQVAGFQSGNSYVSLLAPGTSVLGEVGPTFFGSMAYGATNPLAEFNNVTGGLLGLTFPIAGQNHSGWVRVTINNTAGTFVINDWAYELTPGADIQAGAVPEPAHLGLLAAGAAGLAALRKRRRKDK